MKILRSERGWQVAKNRENSGICLHTLAFICGYRITLICDKLRCSERHLLDIFKRDIGLRAKDWMRQERVVVARRMLASGKPPNEVATLLGFNATQNFRRDFMDFHNATPAEFQERRYGETGLIE